MRVAAEKNLDIGELEPSSPTLARMIGTVRSKLELIRMWPSPVVIK
jgi:hypothetical protein